MSLFFLLNPKQFNVGDIYKKHSVLKEDSPELAEEIKAKIKEFNTNSQSIKELSISLEARQFDVLGESELETKKLDALRKAQEIAAEILRLEEEEIATLIIMMD